MKLVYILIATLMFFSCGEDKVTFSVMPEKNPPGQDNPVEETTCGTTGEQTVTAFRDYDPSQFFPTDATLAPGAYTLPDEVAMSGSAGTGWVSFKTDKYKYCYQGDGVNNSDVGTKFVFEHVTEPNLNCSSGGLAIKPDYVTFDSVTATLSVDGGGVSGAIRTFTTATIELTIKRF